MHEVWVGNDINDPCKLIKANSVAVVLSRSSAFRYEALPRPWGFYSPEKLTAGTPKMEVDGSDDFPFQRGDFQVNQPLVYRGCWKPI